MANTSGRGVNVPDLQIRPIRASDLPQVQYANNSGVNLQQSDSLFKTADFLHKTSMRVQDRLDKKAINEADLRGVNDAIAGNYELRRDATLSGDAYDAAALRTLSAKEDAVLRADAERIYSENQNNPDRLKLQLDALRNGKISSSLPDEIKANIDITLSRIAPSYIGQAQKNLSASVALADKNSAMQALNERDKSIERLALFAENSPQNSAELAMEIEQYKDFLLNHAPKNGFEFDGEIFEADNSRSGLMSLEVIQNKLADITAKTAENRIIGKFSQIENPIEQQEYIQAFEEEFFNPESETGFTLEQADRLSRYMKSRVARDNARENGASEFINSQIKSAQKILEQGGEISPEMITQIENQAMLSGDQGVMGAVQNAKSLISYQQTIRQMVPSDLQNVVNIARQELRNTDDIGQAAVIAERASLAEKMLSNMKTGLKQDKLSWANKVGIADIEPLVLAGENAQASIQKRISDAYTVKSHYGGDLSFLTAEDKDALIEGFNSSDEENKLALMQSITLGFGDDAMSVFGEISQDAPFISQVGSISVQSIGGAYSAKQAIKGQELITAGINALPDIANYRMSIDETIGDAFNIAPATMPAIIDTAKAIYTAKASSGGIASPDAFDDELFRKSLNMAVGGWYDQGGEQYGGFGEHEGNDIVLPSNTTQDEFNQLWDNLDDNDLFMASVGEGMPLFASGDPLTAEELKDYYLVSSGNNKYLVSQTDPATGRLRFLQGANSAGLYEIDFSKLKERSK